MKSGAGAGTCPKANSGGSRRKKLPGGGKGAGASGKTENNPGGGRLLWGKRSKLTKQQQRDFARLVLGRFCKPKGTRATFAGGDPNGQNVSINGCRKSREEARRRKLRNWLQIWIAEEYTK